MKGSSQVDWAGPESSAIGEVGAMATLWQQAAQMPHLWPESGNGALVAVSAVWPSWAWWPSWPWWTSWCAVCPRTAAVAAGPQYSMEAAANPCRGMADNSSQARRVRSREVTREF